MQIIDLHVPTTDGREVLLTHYTKPGPNIRLLLDKMKFKLPDQLRPKITIEPNHPVTPRVFPTLQGPIHENQQHRCFTSSNRRS